MIDFFKWLFFISWWELPFALLAFIAGHIWFALKVGWEAGNKSNIWT